MKKYLLTGMFVLALAGAAQALTTNFLFNSGFNNGGLIPDANLAGWSDTRNITDVPLSDVDGPNLITNLSVILTISGGYNGDLYGYLVHSSGFAVLLNRSGKTGINAFGYGDSGYTITLNDAAANGDLHFYRNMINPNGGALVGTFAPDGRNTNPLLVDGTETRDALLGSYYGDVPNGLWTLFIADLSVGAQSTVQSWELVMDVSPIPEPSVLALAGLGLAGWFFHRRCKV